MVQSSDADEVLVTRIDWPFFAQSSVIALNKRTLATRPLLGASAKEPKLYGSLGCVIDGKLWVAESYDNEILCVDLASGNISARFDASPVLGLTKGQGVRGIIDSFDFLDCLTLVP